jgi:hypothetical protein
VMAGNLKHRTARGRGTWAVLLALSAAVLLALAPGAVAKTEPVSGGKTTLKIKKAVAEFLADTGTEVKATDPAKDRKSGIKLPIKKGELDAKKVKGSLKHDGGIELKGDGGEAELTKFAAEFGKSSKLKAKVDKKNTALFELDTDNARAKDKNGTITYSGIKVILTSKGLTLIEEVTDMELEDRETVFGKLKVAATPGDLVLEGGDASLSLDSVFTTGGASASAVAPATQGAGKLGFPVTGGKVAPDGGSGTVRTDGGLRLSQGGGNLELTKLRINLGNGEISGQLAGNRITFASFDASQAEVTLKKKNVTITGIKAELTADGATALNEAFGGTAFSEGQAFGDFEVKAIPKSSGGGGGDEAEPEPEGD